MITFVSLRLCRLSSYRHRYKHVTWTATLLSRRNGEQQSIRHKHLSLVMAKGTVHVESPIESDLPFRVPDGNKWTWNLEMCFYRAI